MKRLNYLRTGLICMLLALFAGYSGASAQNTTPAPTNLEGFYSQNMNGNIIVLTWNYVSQQGPNQGSLPLFKVYMANGETQVLSDFAVVSSDSTNHMGKPNRYAADITVNASGKYSFYVTATSNNNESQPSNIVTVNAQTVPTITFTAPNPPASATIGQPYTYDFNAQSDSTGDIVTFEMLGNVGSIDSVTGVFSWTPTKSGIYPFNVVARGINPISYNIFSWEVMVNKCQNPAKLTGTVKDKKGNLINEGKVTLVERRDSTTHGGMQQYLDADIVNGQYSFTNIDEGTYIITASGKDFYMDWDSTGGNILTFACGDVKTQDLTVKSLIRRFLQIVSEPKKIAAVNTPYTYQIEVAEHDSTTIGQYTYKYALLEGPVGASLDSATGLLTWTPTQKEIKSFKVMVWDANEPDVYDYQMFSVRVQNCDKNTVFNLTVKYEGTDSLVNYAVAYLIGDSTNLQLSDRKYSYGLTVHDGTVSFDDVDEGIYRLAVATYDNPGRSTGDKYWYLNATSKADATPITFGCGDTVNITFYIPMPKVPQHRTVSGKIVRASDGTPICHAFVEFICLSQSNKGYSYLGTMTEANGEYTIQLMDDCKYIARASGVVLDSSISQMPVQMYLPIYYDQVANPSDAEHLSLDSNLTGINFALSEKSVNQNSLSGIITDSDGFPVEGASVLAFKLNNPQSNNKNNVIGTTTNQAGVYTFENMDEGSYIIFASDCFNHSYVAGYYVDNATSTWSWKYATVVNVTSTSNLSGINIQLNKTRKVFGKGRIHGCVGAHKGKLGNGKLGKDVIAGVNVYLYDNNGNIIGTIESDKNGEFEFEELTVGQYVVKADKVGYGNMVSEVTIGSEDEVASADFSMDDSATGIEEVEILNAAVYPNPAAESINVTFSGVAGTALISVVNSDGAEVLSMNSNAVTGLNSVHISNLNLPSGVYFVRIINNGSTTAIPFVVSK